MDGFQCTYFVLLITYCVSTGLISARSVIHERCPDSTKPTKLCSKDSDCPGGTSCFDLLYFENGICCPDKLFSGPDASSGRVRKELDSGGGLASINLKEIPVALLRKLARNNFMVPDGKGGVKHISDTTQIEKLQVLKRHLMEEKLQGYVNQQEQERQQPTFLRQQTHRAQEQGAAMNQVNSASNIRILHVQGPEIFEGYEEILPQPPGPHRPVITQNTCAYSKWSGWTSCTARCGTGSKKRIKQALSGQDDYCNRVLKETRPCNTRDCTATDSLYAFYNGAPGFGRRSIQRSQSESKERTKPRRKPSSRSRSSTSRTRTRTEIRPQASRSFDPFGGSYESFDSPGHNDWIRNFNEQQDRMWSHTSSHFNRGFNNFGEAHAPPINAAQFDGAVRVPGSCADRISKSDCKSFKNSGYCDHDVSIRNSCKKTCNVC